MTKKRLKVDSKHIYKRLATEILKGVLKDLDWTFFYISQFDYSQMICTFADVPFDKLLLMFIRKYKQKKGKKLDSDFSGFWELCEKYKKNGVLDKHFLQESC